MLDDTKKVHEDILQTLLDYSKYLYEEENSRRDRLNNAVKVYIGLLTFILGIGAIQLIPLGELIILYKSSGHPIALYAGLTLFAISAVFFCISFIFTILVLKMWPFERLSDPRALAIKSVFVEHKTDCTSSMISDYVTACNVNHKINNKKSRLLSRALSFLITGLILFAMSLCIVKVLSFIQGGIK